MCGIAGILRNSGDRVQPRELKAMTDSIAHRGPDGEGQWVSEDGRVGLGHRRLSIIDLSEAGSQPMHYMGRYSIVFNGEIYNYVELKDALHAKGYRFQNATDTEVIMAAYDAKGRACLADFDGMFAFAIYDKVKDEVFCARDRFGEKPLYYYQDKDQIIFGSEIKTIWALGIERTFNDYAVYNYIVNNKPVGELRSDTFYDQIHQLMPAHTMTISVHDPKICQEKYWKVDITQRKIKAEEAIERLSSLFATSVTRRLRSDVPVGSSLSGGLDSSMVVGYMAQADVAAKQNTFSAAFPGFARDESQYQRMMAEYAKTNHHATSPDMGQTLHNFDTILHHQEEPFSSMSIAIQYEVFKLAKDQGVSVLLDGQGADEILSGYSYFTFSYLRELAKRGRLGTMIYRARQAAKKQAKPSSYFLGGALSDVVPQRIVDKYRSANGDAARAMLNPDFAQKYKDIKEKDLEIPNTLNEALDLRTNVYGLDQLLRYCDRNAMAHAVEVRLPFLNHELVEFVFSLPSDLKIYKGWTKWIARKAAQGYVPEEIIWRKEKIAYESPDNFLYEHQNEPSILSATKDSAIGAYFDSKAVAPSPKLFFRKVMVGKMSSK